MKKFLMLLLTVALLVASTETVDAAEGSTWEFGASASSGTTSGSTQGENGWYFMWTPQVDANGSFSEGKIKECVAAMGRVSTWVAFGKGLIADGGTKIWVPEIYTDKSYDAFANNNWWIQDLDGAISPAVVLGERASSVIGWKAQEAGEYKIEMAYTVGCQKDGQGAPESDGVTISINSGGECLDKHVSGEKTLDSGELSAEVSLKKGEMIYVIADANGSGAYDTATVDIKITQTKVESDSDKEESNKEESNKTESNKEESNKAESNKTESNKTESNKTESNKTESNKAESNKTESNKTESNKTESNKTESNKTESNKTETNKEENKIEESATEEPEDVPENTPEDSTDAPVEEEPEDVPEDTPEDSTDASVEEEPEDVPEDIPEDSTDVSVEEESEDVPEDTLGDTADQDVDVETDGNQEEPAPKNAGWIVAIVVVVIAAVAGVVFYKKKGLKK